MKKVCTGQCGLELPATTEYFDRQPQGKYGLTAKCKRCRKGDGRYYYVKNRKKVLDRTNAKWKNRRSKDRWARIKRTYGIDEEQYNTILHQQNGVCAVCGRPPKDGTYLHVDHDHLTGKIRGLLCHKCNMALGAFDGCLDKAASYLVRNV